MIILLYYYTIILLYYYTILLIIMFRQLNEPNYLQIKTDSDNYYMIICNTSDKKLAGVRNDSIINILCSITDDADISLFIKDLFKNVPKIGSVVQYKNVFFCYTMKTGGKPSLIDTVESRMDYFIRSVIQIKSIIISASSKRGDLYCDYSNIIIDAHNDYILYYKKLLSTLCKEHDLNINIVINTKVKLLPQPQQSQINYKSTEPELDLTKLKYISDISFNISDIYNI